jgi:citrate lyase subunit beta/citryl-CoA lyase
MIPRTYLYVPGDRPERFGKALASGADAVILDLEDAVAPARKAQAREEVVGFVRALEPPPSVEVWVRVNAADAGVDDLRGLASVEGLTGVCVPKVESARQLVELDALLAELGVDWIVEPLLESGASLFAACEIAGAPRVRRLQVGEVDLAADLGVTPGPEETELLWARSTVVAASASAAIEAPVGPVSPDFADLDALARSTESLRRLGFWGRACIHPAQLPVVGSAFRSEPEELAWAREVIAALEGAVGAAKGPDGRLIDEAVARIARRVLMRSESANA